MPLKNYSFVKRLMSARASLTFDFFWCNNNAVREIGFISRGSQRLDQWTSTRTWIGDQLFLPLMVDWWV